MVSKRPSQEAEERRVLEMAEIKDKGKVARVPVFQTPPKAQYQRQNKKKGLYKIFSS